MRILLLLLSSLQIINCSCPSGFELVREGECRGRLDYSIQVYFVNGTEVAVQRCQTVQAQPIIIHNDEHQSFFQGKYGDRLLMGLTCNTRSKRWEWVDGTSVDYKPSNNYNKELDEECTTGCAWFMDSSNGHWGNSCTDSWNWMDIWCTTPTEKPEAKDCDNFDNDIANGACYQIGTAAKSWQDAQMLCRNYGGNLASIHNKQENDFLRQLANKKGAVTGLYLGGTITGKGNDGFGWIDGTEWDYTNFYPGFPVSGLGDCLMIDTFGTSGQWMNMDCNTQLSVACVRTPNASVADVCSGGPWKEGQIIYTPGYPYDASVSCDYFLTVDAGKRVELKVQLLEANTCCDHLLLSDNYFGGNVLANLTGEISGKTYTTATSNLMRVSWNPVGGVNVRGAMFSFRAV